MFPVLRPYQCEIVNAVMDSVRKQRGLTFSVEIARQGGKNKLSAPQRAQLQGSHPRRRCPEPGKIYIAAIDLAGEAEQLEGEQLIALNPRQDSTVVTIAEIDLSRVESMNISPVYHSANHTMNQNSLSLDGRGEGEGVHSSSLTSGIESKERWERCFDDAPTPVNSRRRTLPLDRPPPHRALSSTGRPVKKCLALPSRRCRCHRYRSAGRFLSP